MTQTACQCLDADKVHPDHSKQLHRINRLIGQLAGVKRMIDERQYCPDILTQTRAVASALSALEAEILRTHLEGCVNQAFASGDVADSEAKVAELIDIFKKFKRA